LLGTKREYKNVAFGKMFVFQSVFSTKIKNTAGKFLIIGIQTTENCGAVYCDKWKWFHALEHT
jgi:hypothetical protein